MLGSALTTDDIGFEKMLARIEAAASADIAWDALSDFARQHGFSGVCCKCFPSEAETDKRVFFSSTRGFDDAVAAFVSEAAPSDDPLLFKSLRSTRPFLFSQLDKNCPHHHAQNRWIKNLDDGNDAIVVPVFGPLIRHGYFCFLGSNEDTRGQLYKSFVHVVAQVAYLRMCELFFSTDLSAIGLSQREREVMRSVAEGQSNTEIASNIGISVRTVETYLNRIFDKLGVRDRVRASLRAYALGLLA